MEEEKKEPKGIGGWMILPIIGMFLTILLQLFNAIDILLYYDIYANQALLIWNFAFIILAGGSLICIFKKLRLGRNLAITHYILLIVFSLFAYDIVSLIGGLIWMFYFLHSKRINNTLVN